MALKIKLFSKPLYRRILHFARYSLFTVYTGSAKVIGISYTSANSVSRATFVDKATFVGSDKSFCPGESFRHHYFVSLLQLPWLPIPQTSRHKIHWSFMVRQSCGQLLMHFTIFDCFCKSWSAAIQLSFFLRRTATPTYHIFIRNLKGIHLSEKYHAIRLVI